MKKMNHNPRSCILRIGATSGRLCAWMGEHEEDTTRAILPVGGSTQRPDVSCLIMIMVDLLKELYWTSISLNLHWVHAVHSKLELNRRKYPVELCKGKAGKYTHYSHVTGVTVDNQSTITTSSSAAAWTTTATDTAAATSKDDLTAPPVLSWSEFLTQVPLLISTIEEFANERQWTKFHTPRNLVLALLGEVGELAEIVQWKGEDGEQEEDSPVDPSRNSIAMMTTTTTTTVSARFSPAELDHLSQEIADVSIYLLRLVSVTNTTDAVMSQLS